VYRTIMLEENELRKVIQSESESDSNNNVYIPATNNNLTMSYASSSSISSTPNILSPTSTLQRQDANPMMYPAPQILPVHFTQLPMPQQPGYYQMISHPQPQYHMGAGGYAKR
jgi:hypothetical protein